MIVAPAAPEMVVLVFPVSEIVPVPGVKVPVLIQLPDTVCVKFPAENAPPEAMFRFPFTVSAPPAVFVFPPAIVRLL